MCRSRLCRDSLRLHGSAVIRSSSACNKIWADNFWLVSITKCGLHPLSQGVPLRSAFVQGISRSAERSQRLLASELLQEFEKACAILLIWVQYRLSDLSAIHQPPESYIPESVCAGLITGIASPLSIPAQHYLIPVRRILRLPLPRVQPSPRRPHGQCFRSFRRLRHTPAPVRRGSHSCRCTSFR